MLEKEELKVRIANVEDAEELLNIYSYYVLNTAISFDYIVPTLAKFRKKILKIKENYPFLVATINNEIVGYCYASDFVGREAYIYGAETTIYVKNSLSKKGVGKALYNELEKICKKQNIIKLCACIGYKEPEDRYVGSNSVDFHEHMGYSFVGKFENAGYKFNNWYNMIWMEKNIGEYSERPNKFIPFSTLDL